MKKTVKTSTRTTFTLTTKDIQRLIADYINADGGLSEMVSADDVDFQTSSHGLLESAKVVVNQDYS